MSLFHIGFIDKQVNKYKWSFYRLMSVLMKWEDDGVKVDPGCPSKPGSHQPSSPEASSAYLGTALALLCRSHLSLFLGPKLWEKPIQAKFNEDDFFVMNIDEFLAENNLQVSGNVSPHGNFTIRCLAWGASRRGGERGEGGEESRARGARLRLTLLHGHLRISPPCRGDSHHQAFDHCLQRWAGSSRPIISKLLRHNETECSSANPWLPLQRVKAGKAGEGEGGEEEEEGSWDWVCTRGSFSSNQLFFSRVKIFSSNQLFHYRSKSFP